MDPFLSAARDIGLMICRDAVWWGDRCTWLRAAPLPESDPPEYEYRAAGSSFYDGTAGVALFLGYLSRYVDDRSVARTAKGAIHEALARADGYPSHLALGFFSGYSGVAYAVHTLSKIFGDPLLAEQSETIARKALDISLADASLDVIGGVAGAVPALSAIAKSHPDLAARTPLLALGEHLLNTAERSASGWSWRTVARSSRNLSGFSHGAAGLTNALLQLWLVSGETRYLEAAYRSNAYENSLFDSSVENWRDLRIVDGDSPRGSRRGGIGEYCSSFWCHGAPGIGQARLNAYRATNDDAFLRDLEIAVATTVRDTVCEGPNNGFALCHGVLGNAELLLNSASTVTNAACSGEAERLGSYVIEHYLNRQIPIPNGIGNEFEIACFMTGLAGIGYFFLRVHDNGLPSILALQL